MIVTTNQGQPVALAAKSLAGRSFNNIAKRLKGEDVPWLDLNEKDGIFNRLGRIISGGG